MKKLLLFLIAFVIMACVYQANACTTFIISGKYTPDGKPILFKHRDTGTLDNALVNFSDGKYDYVGVVNSAEDWETMVWGGYNSAGFAIMNSAAYNNNVGDTTKFIDQEGVVMKLALQSCATIDDFEKLLNDLPKPLGVDANFGVIDAKGGAAYFETGNYKFKKVDVNDPINAPHGFVVRTNHSFSGEIEEGYGYIRYSTAYSVLYEAAALRKLEPQYLFNKISRNLTHALTKTNLWDNLPPNKNVTDFKFFNDYIPRNSSASTMMVIGIDGNESPKNTMMWIILGFPLTTVAVPVWLSGGELPKLMSMKEDLHAPLCDAGMLLKKDCFPIERGSGWKYINLSTVINKEDTGYLQLLQSIENEMFEKTNVLLKEMQERGYSKTKIQKHYKWIDNYVSKSYKKLFEIEMSE